LITPEEYNRLNREARKMRIRLSNKSIPNNERRELERALQRNKKAKQEYNDFDFGKTMGKTHLKYAKNTVNEIAKKEAIERCNDPQFYEILKYEPATCVKGVEAFFSEQEIKKEKRTKPKKIQTSEE
jgi:hypothetical protein